jgi:hypothetical protein
MQRNVETMLARKLIAGEMADETAVTIDSNGERLFFRECNNLGTTNLKRWKR